MPISRTFCVGREVRQQSVHILDMADFSHEQSLIDRYQWQLAKKLSVLFPSDCVVTEWRAMADENGLYSPRLDIAVGPFAFEESYIDRYNFLMRGSRQFIARAIAYHLENVQKFDGSTSRLSFSNLLHKNPNARCFLSIEIENRVNRKHLLGGMVNASALGRIGFAVAWTEDKLKAFVKIRKYLRFLERVDKNTFESTNLLILSKDQMQHLVKEVIDDRH